MSGEVLVVGIGNPIRGDDGLGWRAAELLESRFIKISLPVISISVQQLTMDLVDDISGASLVVFIDAAVGDLAGQIKQQEISAGTSQAASVTHFFDPFTLLASVRALYGTHPPALFFTLSTRTFEYSEELSPPIQSALPDFVNRIEKAIFEFQSQVIQPII
jgi:hydrogenase maturation protease